MMSAVSLFLSFSAAALAHDLRPLELNSYLVLTGSVNAANGVSLPNASLSLCPVEESSSDVDSFFGCQRTLTVGSARDVQPYA